MLEEERKLVLNMLAEGKITPEQAAELLRALGESVAPEEPAVGEPLGNISENMREAVHRARQVAREAARAARDEARKARAVFREAHRESQGGFSVDLGGLGGFIDNMVNTMFSPLGHQWDDTYEGSFAAGPVHLDLQTNNGSVRCRSWAGPGYKLVLHVRAGGPDEAEARRRAADAIQVEHGSEGITLRVHDDWARRVGSGADLYLPEGPEYHLTAGTGNGSIHLESGSFDTARLRTGNGSIENSATVGDLDVATGNGSVRATARGTGQWSLSTGNGSVRVDTSALGDTAVEVNASTGAGRINVEIPGASTQQGGLGTVKVHLNSPNFAQAASRLSVRVRTGLGSITVRHGA